MVEKAPSYHVAFKAIPPLSSLLGNLAPLLDADVTNPRELYSMLSEARQQKGLLASLTVNPNAGARLPPLEASAEAQLRPLGEQTQYSSYPDLMALRRQPGAACKLDTVRRSTSLMDVSAAGDGDDASMLRSKKLKPILKHGAEHQDRGGVKFGQKEVHVIKDPPLPPIEGVGGLPSGKGTLSFYPKAAAPVQAGSEDSYFYSPRVYRRSGQDRPLEIFPRGQPRELKKPMTPTYDDYPEAYWELRSPTVQEPSDLKEDMIDRDRYRLQQISSLHLRAMDRETVPNRLDSYRKWQKQMQDSSPQLHSGKHSSLRATATPNAAAANGQGNSSARNGGKQPRLPLPVRNHTLSVSATSITPTNNPAIKKRNGGNVTNEQLTDDEVHRREKIDAAARAALDKAAQGNETKPLKAAVVNLCMDTDQTSEVYMGIRKITVGARRRPQSDKVRTQFYNQNQNSDGENAAQTIGLAENLSIVSNNATLGSSQSNRPRVPSAPVATPPVSQPVPVANGGGESDSGTPNGSKKILKKFNRLQVFSENAALALDRQPSGQSWDVSKARATEKKPYLPEKRPPTYRLDMRNRHSRDLSGFGDEGYPLPDSKQGKFVFYPISPEKSEAATSLSFRFRNGEVIVSRQGKKPNMT